MNEMNKLYVEMCTKAEEIQAHVREHGAKLPTMAWSIPLDTIVVCVWLPKAAQDKFGLPSECNAIAIGTLPDRETGKETVGDTLGVEDIWLPSQAELQAMLPGRWHEVQEKMWYYLRQKDMEFNALHVMSNYASPEGLWLGLVMHILYRKKWDIVASEWVALE